MAFHLSGRNTYDHPGINGYMDDLDEMKHVDEGENAEEGYFD